MAARASARPAAMSAARLTEEQLCRWVGRAEAGARIEYHHGHLSVDRSHETTSLDEKARQGLAKVADRAFALAGEGLLILVQRRLDEGGFSYLAIKASAPVRRATAAKFRLPAAA